jgi:hypothetical protein
VKPPVLLRADKSNEYLTGRPVHIYDTVSLNSAKNKKFLAQICRENQNTHCIFSNIFSENRAVYELMWKKSVQLDCPQMVNEYGSSTFHAG